MLNGQELYNQAKELGIEMDHYQTDLYMIVNVDSAKLIKEYQFKNSVTKFVCNIDHEVWYDIPFCYYGNNDTTTFHK